MPPREPHDDFLATKNLQTNQPIWLYRIEVPDVTGQAPLADLFIAEYNVAVAYFKTDAAVHSAQTYDVLYPIRHKGISEDSSKRTNSLTIIISNVNLAIGAYMLNYNAFKGAKVTIRQVFQENLANNTAYIEDIFYVDSAHMSGMDAVFRLVSHMDVHDVQIPRRRYMRNFCMHTYKGRGCWVTNPTSSGGTFIAPSGFEIRDMSLYNDEEINDDAKPAEVEVDFHYKDTSKVNTTSDFLLISLKSDDYLILNADGVNGLASYIAIATPAKYFNEVGKKVLTGYDPDVDYIRYAVDPTNIAGQAVTDVWKQFVVPLSGYTIVGKALDTSVVGHVRWVQSAWDAGAEQSCSCDVRNILLRISTPHDFTIGGEAFDYCLKTLSECRRHNNQNRYGAFPNVPRRKNFRF